MYWLFEVADAGRDAVELVAGQVELRQSRDGADRQRKRAQVVVGQVQHPQLTEPAVASTQQQLSQRKSATSQLKALHPGPGNHRDFVSRANMLT